MKTVVAAGKKAKIMKRVENKVAVVTGGALGIGRETCILLAKEGIYNKQNLTT